MNPAAPPPILTLATSPSKLVPLTSIPTSLTLNTVAFPLIPTSKLPLTTLILALLVPLEILEDPPPGFTQLSVPAPSVLSICPLVPPVIITLPLLPRFALVPTVRLDVVTLLFTVTLPLVIPSALKFALVVAPTVTTTLPAPTGILTLDAPFAI